MSDGTRIPGAGTLADAVKARDSRQMEADAWARGHLLNTAIRQQLAAWVENGGPAPWLTAEERLGTYPPQPATTPAQPI